MSSDPIIDEIREIRQHYAAQFGFDIRAMVRDAQQCDAAGDRKVVRLPPRRPVSEGTSPRKPWQLWPSRSLPPAPESVLTNRLGGYSALPKKGLKMTRDHHVTGNVGLCWTCYQLSRRGWNAMPTSRNARGVDIIAYNRDCSNKIAIQMKTLSKRNPVPLGTSFDAIMADFWVIVNDVLATPQAYVLLPSEVKERAHRGEKEGRVSFWLQPCAYCLPEFHEAWERIGEP